MIFRTLIRTGSVDRCNALRLLHPTGCASIDKMYTAVQKNELSSFYPSHEQMGAIEDEGISSYLIGA